MGGEDFAATSKRMEVHKYELVSPTCVPSPRDSVTKTMRRIRFNRHLFRRGRNMQRRIPNDFALLIPECSSKESEDEIYSLQDD